MAGLNFGSGDLFPETPLLQDDGLLKERWDQENSTIKNFYFATDPTNDVYTVPTGKVVYITDIIINTNNAAGGLWTLYDGTGGTIKLVNSNIAAIGLMAWTFKTPLKFTVKIRVLSVGGNPNSQGTMNGWEEDLK